MDRETWIRYGLLWAVFICFGLAAVLNSGWPLIPGVLIFLGLIATAER